MTEDQLPKLDTGQIKQEKEIDRDGRERERAWKFKNNHTNNVSSSLTNVCGISSLHAIIGDGTRHFTQFGSISFLHYSCKNHDKSR